MEDIPLKLGDVYMYLVILQGSLGTFVNYYRSINEILSIYHLDSIEDLDSYYSEWDSVNVYKIKKQIL